MESPCPREDGERIALAAMPGLIDTADQERPADGFAVRADQERVHYGGATPRRKATDDCGLLIEDW
jgi:hypothetical protein